MSDALVFNDPIREIVYQTVLQQMQVLAPEVDLLHRMPVALTVADGVAEALKRLESPPPRSGDGAQSGEGWRTIDSAPKDGTRVLVDSADWFREDSPEIVCWRHDEFVSERGTDFDHTQPTHWMPLPAPPPASEAGQPASGREDAPAAAPSMPPRDDLYTPEEMQRLLDNMGSEYAKPADPSPAPMAGGETAKLIARALEIVKAGDAYGTNAKPPTSIEVRNLLEKLATALRRQDEAVKKLRSKIIVERHQLAYGGRTVPVGYLCNACGSEWGIIEDEKHEEDCPLSSLSRSGSR